MISDRSATDICLDLVGPIYDCAINPDLWPQTLRRIADAIDCQNGHIFLIDAKQQKFLLNISSGLDDEWLARQADHVAEIEQGNRAPAVIVLPQDEPFVMSRDVPAEVIATSRYINEWARPQGLVDAAQLTFLRTVTRNGGVGFGRHESVGNFEGPAIDVVRQLAPHLRRSLQISDLLEMRSIQNEMMTTALDRISAAAIIVDAGERVVHANEKARKLLDEGITIGLSHNRLTSPDRRAASRLSDALRAATTLGIGEGSALSYFGVRLPGRDDLPCLAHVMPLLGTMTRSRIGALATAAVFVTQADSRPLRVECLAAAFELTPAELNVLSLIADGMSLVEAASRLGIAESTARTHVKNLHRKLGVERQSELVAVVHRLLGPA
jgi:DNA-binding CsgD family transcriptional regulator